MNLVVDVGNSFTKIGLFEGNDLVSQQKKNNMEEVLLYIHKQQPENLIIASVAAYTELLEKQIGNKIKTLFFNAETPVPINNKYDTPETLGSDRLAAAVAANFLFPRENTLSIDIGTCITYDLVDKTGTYLGGAISPGVAMKFKALNTFTTRLPLIEATGKADLIGKTTRDSILSGVLNGTLAEIEEIINQYSNNFNNLKIIICGGDAYFFESRIKATIFVVPELVLIGLNRILQYNVSP
ncbi:type III pantothenate kinase [soil metagenome]